MAKKQSGKRVRRAPKTVLRLPDLDRAKSAVLNSLSSIHAQREYRRAIDEFVDWYCSEPRLPEAGQYRYAIFDRDSIFNPDVMTFLRSTGIPAHKRSRALAKRRRGKMGRRLPG